MRFELPPPVKSTIAALEEAGFQAYAVGGCVRDLLTGTQPVDWDVSTSAAPEETAAVFHDRKVIETGLKHGTLTVLMDGLPIEMTAFRVDGPYSDFRRPDSVAFTRDLGLDLSRRDFTVNAMAYSPGEGLIDPFGGRADIENRIIRCVGDPDTRFGEDALRILRGLRFASALDYTIEAKTAESLLKNRGLLKNIAAERIQKELVKLLCGKAVERVLLDFREVLFEIIPELAPQSGFDQHGEIHIYDVYGHTVHAVASVPPEPELRVTMLLHDSGKPQCFSLDKTGAGCFHGHAAAGAAIAKRVMSDLKFSNKFAEEVITLVERHDLQLFDNPKELKKWLGILGETMFRKLLLVKKADTLSLSPAAYPRLEKIDELGRKADALLKQGACLKMTDMKIDGNALINIGVPEGKTVGEMLGRLFDGVLEGKIENTKNALREAAAKMIEGEHE